MASLTLACTCSLSIRFASLFTHDLLHTSWPPGHYSRHPPVLFSLWLLIKMMVTCLSASAPKASIPFLHFSFLLRLFFAVNYSLELITFFFLFLVVFIFVLPFNSSPLLVSFPWLSFRVDFPHSLCNRPNSYIFIIMLEQRRSFHFYFNY